MSRSPGVGGTSPRDAWGEGRPDGRGYDLAAILLLGVLLAQGLAFIRESSQTSDEAAHLLAGYTYFKTADFRPNREEPPLVKEVAAFPLLLLDLEYPRLRPGEGAGAFRLGPAFVHQNRVANDTILLLGRLPVLCLSLLLGWALYRWGRRLGGARGALLGLALYVLDPNVVAHSSLVTTDLGVTLFIFLAVYALWSWSERPAPRTLFLAGLATGAAFASKFSALWLLPILGGLGVVLLAGGGPIPRRPWSAGSTRAEGPGSVARRLAGLSLALLVLSAGAVLVVAACYAVRGLPEFVAGVARGARHTAAGHTGFLMGRISETGWWYYFLFAYMVKTPIGTLLLVGASFLPMARGARRPFKDRLFLRLPVLLIVGITCFWRINIGLRHLLPIYPFLYLAAGRLAAPLAAPPKRGRSLLRGAFVLACLAWNAIEAASIAPFHLAYFNQLVGGPRNGHLYLLDSNLDWGQSSRALRRYMTDERLPAIYCAFSGSSDPRHYGLSYQYVPGIGNLETARSLSGVVPEPSPREVLAVGAMALHFVRLGNGTLYDWLEGRPVVAMPGYSYLVYDITGDADAHARLAALYLESSLPETADREARRALRIDPGNLAARAVLERLGSFPR